MKDPNQDSVLQRQPVLQLLFSSAPVGALIRTKHGRSNFPLAKGVISKIYIWPWISTEIRTKDENFGRSSSLLAKVGAWFAPGLVTPIVNGFLRPVEHVSIWRADPSFLVCLSICRSLTPHSGSIHCSHFLSSAMLPSILNQTISFQFQKLYFKCNYVISKLAISEIWIIVWFLRHILFFSGDFLTVFKNLFSIARFPSVV